MENKLSRETRLLHKAAERKKLKKKKKKLWKKEDSKLKKLQNGQVVQAR